MVDLVRYYMEFIRNESCGKCIPCREGTGRMLEILESVTKKPLNEDSGTTLERFKGVMQLETISTVMKDASLCGLGQTAPNPFVSALKNFREEFEEHIFDRKCRANICRGLRTFSINVESVRDVLSVQENALLTRFTEPGCSLSLSLRINVSAAEYVMMYASSVR